MPLVRRRKLSLEENNAGNNEGNRSESSNAASLTPDKATCGTQAQDDQTSGAGGVEKRTGATKRPRLESNEDGKDSQAPPVPPTPAIRTSTRIIKRKEKDSCQSETPVKKPAKESKTPERKRAKKRQWELWSMEDKDTFFEGLFEYGKDFDAIHNLIVQKNRKKGMPLSLIKNKDQVRFFYYRSIQKLSKIVAFTDNAIKKDTMELYALISYGTLRKSVKRFVLNDKMAPKLRELLFQGATTVRLKGKNKRVKTPVCNALKKLNNVDDVGELDPVLIPEKVTLELKPRTNAAWSRVQSTAQNPVVRLKVASDHSMGSIIAFLNRKWKSLRVRQLEELENVEETEKLTLYCTSDFPLHPHVLRPHKQPRINVTFENYRNNVLANLGSPNNGAKKTPEDGAEELDGDVKPLPKTPVQAAKEAPASKHDDACIADLTLLADDNAVFPDNPLTTKSTPPKAGKDGAQSESQEVGGSNAPSTKDETGGEGEDGVQEEKLEEEGKEIAEKVKKPLTAENSDTLTVGQLALVFGLKEAVRFEYDWVEERPVEDDAPLEVRTSKVSNMLQCLANLASLEYNEFHLAKTRQKTDKNACLLCGVAPNRNTGKKDGQNGRGKAKGPRPKMRDAACNTMELLSLVEPPRLPLPIQQPCVVMTKKDGEILATPSAVPVPGTMIGQLPGKVPNATGDGVFRVPLPAPLVRYKTTTIPTIPSLPNKANFLVPRKRKVKPQRRNGTPMLLPKMTGVPVMMVQTLGGVSSASEAPVAHTFSPTNLATSQTIAITNLCVGGEAPDSAAASVTTTAATSALSSMSQQQQQPLQVSVKATFSSETMVSPSVPTSVITSMQPLSIVTSHPIAAAATLVSEPQYMMPGGNLLLSPLSVGMATPTSATPIGVSTASIAPPSETSLSSNNYLGLLDISLPEASNNSVDAADKLLGLTGPGFSGLLESKGGNHLELGLRMPPLHAPDESSQMSLDMSPLKQLTLGTDTQWLNKVTKQLGMEISPEKRDSMPVSTPQTDFGPPFSTDSNMSMDNFMCQAMDERKSSVPSTSTAQTPPFISQCLIPSGDDLSFSTLIDSKNDDSFSQKLEATTKLLTETLYGSQVKKEPGRASCSTAPDLLQPPYFSEISQDAIVKQLEVDHTLQVILNENSLDYVAKFEPLTATLEETTENSVSLDTTSRDKT